MARNDIMPNYTKRANRRNRQSLGKSAVSSDSVPELPLDEPVASTSVYTGTIPKTRKPLNELLVDEPVASTSGYTGTIPKTRKPPNELLSDEPVASTSGYTGAMPKTRKALNEALAVQYDSSDSEGYLQGYFGGRSYGPKAHILHEYSRLVHGEIDLSANSGDVSSDECRAVQTASEVYSSEEKYPASSLLSSNDQESTELTTTSTPQTFSNSATVSCSSTGSNALYHELEAVADQEQTQHAYLAALEMA